MSPQRIDIALNFLKNELKILELESEEKIIINFDIEEFEKLWNGFIRSTSFNNQTLSNFRYFLAMRSIDEKKKGITLSTIHTAKGLEYEIVFLIGMNNGVLPFYKAKTKKELIEEKNNAYVAITRAKHCINITYPKNRKSFDGQQKQQQMSRFISYFKA